MEFFDLNEKTSSNLALTVLKSEHFDFGFEQFKESKTSKSNLNHEEVNEFPGRLSDHVYQKDEIMRNLFSFIEFYALVVTFSN